MSKKQKAKNPPPPPKPILKILLVSLLGILAITLLTYGLFLYSYQNKIYPGVRISGQEVAGQTPLLTYQSLNSNFQNRAKNPLKLTYQEQNFNLDLTESSPSVDLKEKTQEAFMAGRSGNLIKNFIEQIKNLLLTKNYNLTVNYQKLEALQNQVSQIALLTKKDPVNAQVTMAEDVTFTPSAPGQVMDQDQLLKQIENYLALQTETPGIIPVKTLNPAFSTTDAETAQKTLVKIKATPIKLRFESQEWIIDQKNLLDWFNFDASAAAKVSSTTNQMISPETASQPLPLNQSKLDNFLVGIAAKIETEAKDAKFDIDPNEPNLRVTQFQPAQEGKKLDLQKTADLIKQSLTSDTSTDIQLPVSVTAPKITTDSVNDFGIKQLLAEGVSNFSGSIENRIFNVGLAASRLHGILIAPGKTFSFNKALGDVDAASGYKPAYVIKSGRTVLDDGGGVCQVSTTLFRAILKAGLPITERTAHAYRVGYYEQGFPPGLDATVFSPSVDLKFKNDTPSYILIQTKTVGTTLYIDLYGTADGRVSEVSTPVISSQTPPPPEVRQDDPTLPRGTVKQVDWSAWGANVSFKRTVTKDGQTLISETWRSNYKPWAAVYLVGTQ
jgi:vancomycin resistance protein YoaR